MSKKVEKLERKNAGDKAGGYWVSPKEKSDETTWAEIAADLAAVKVPEVLGFENYVCPGSEKDRNGNKNGKQNRGLFIGDHFS